MPKRRNFAESGHTGQSFSISVSSFEDDTRTPARMEQEEPGRLELRPEDAAVHDGGHHHRQLRGELPHRLVQRSHYFFVFLVCGRSQKTLGIT